MHGCHKFCDNRAIFLSLNQLIHNQSLQTTPIYHLFEFNSNHKPIIMICTVVYILVIIVIFGLSGVQFRESSSRREHKAQGRFKITSMISNGNMTEWTPIRSVIIQVVTKLDDRAAGV